MRDAVGDPSASQGVVIDLAVDAWKFSRLFQRVLARLDAGDQARYLNQMRFFERRVEAAADAVGARLVSIEGQPYEAGAAATPLNLGDFGEGESLVVEQMLEPIVMGSDGVLRMGVVLLRSS